MLNNGCVPSESGPTEVTADFRFTRVMAEQAARARLTLDDDQLSLIARLDALGQQLVSTTGRPQGVYVWGRTGRGKSFILDHFFASLPLAARRRVHFHHFFRELHQRLNAPGAPDLQTVMRQMTSGCRLLCFDEFHLHDPGDAMLIKALLEHLFQHGIVLLATSNYPPEMLLPNPLYHDRFLPSIALIRAHLTVVALNGEEDYRERHLSQDNAFCSGRMWVNPNAQQRQLYDLPSLPGEPVSLTVGYRTLLAAAASPALLHFTFTQLCQAATAVMDYLTLCESYAVWLLDEVPPLATVGPAAQQRFINVIDVLYEKQIRLLLVTRCDLETLVAGVELEDIQRTRVACNSCRGRYKKNAPAGAGARGLQIEAVEVHHLGPGGNEVMHQLLLPVGAGVHFRQGAQYRVGAKHQIHAGGAVLRFAGFTVAAGKQLRVIIGRFPDGSHIQQINEEVIAEHADAVGKHPVFAVVVVRAQYAQATDQHGHFRGG